MNKGREMSFKENELLNNLCKEFEVTPTRSLHDSSIYEEIANFQDAEYIYNIAYEMLIRTDEYQTLIKEYEVFKNESSDEIIEEEFIERNRLIEKMNALGLKRTSFLGFDTESDGDNVFEMIKQYEEIKASAWKVRMVKKFESADENIFYQIIKFYNAKKELRMLFPDDKIYKEIIYDDLTMQEIKEVFKLKTEESLPDYNSFLDCLCVATIKNRNGNPTPLRDIYLRELDTELLDILNEKQDRDLLISIKSDHIRNNIEYWYKFAINDITNGLEKLIDYYKNSENIFDRNGNRIDQNNLNKREDFSDIYIPCINRLLPLEVSDIQENMIDEKRDFEFRNFLKMDGHNIILAREGYLEKKNIFHIYLVNIHKYLPLAILEDDFLNQLRYEDLKNKYIETEPLYSRPRLMFDDARLTNIPINLNLSKEDLLLYIAKIKDDFDENHNIIKNDFEYFFNQSLPSASASIPRHIKEVDKKSSTKKLFPLKRKEFKKNLAKAFYVYDLYKFFLPLFDKKRTQLKRGRDECIERSGRKVDSSHDYDHEIKDYENNNLITQISYIVEDLSDEQVQFYLATMKEFIHGVNQKNENNPFKLKYNPDQQCKDRNPKYKNLIIGRTYIMKSNKNDLIDALGL